MRRLGYSLSASWSARSAIRPTVTLRAEASLPTVAHVGLAFAPSMRTSVVTVMPDACARSSWV